MVRDSGNNRGKTAITPSRRPRIQDVASLAGVSLGAVSAVLNGNGRLSAATRDRVRSAIRNLGYRPDLYASNLARRQTHVLGLIVSNLQNPFFSETAQAIEEEAARRNYQVSLMATNFSPERQRSAIERLLGARVAGIAVITSEHDKAARRLLVSSRIPSVFLDVARPVKSSAAIQVDSMGGMRSAVEHLIELGHRKILFVRSAHDQKVALLSHTLRNDGFTAAVRAYRRLGVIASVVDADGSDAAASERAVLSALGRTSFTAVVAINDVAAMGVCRGLQANGLKVPDDVSVVGFDDTYFARFLNPPLTTVRIPCDQLSRKAVELLMTSTMKHGSNKLYKLETALVVRESTGPPCPVAKTVSGFR